MTEIPQVFYYSIGILVIGNLSVIITLLTFIFKAGYFVAETKDGIKDSKDTGIRAHKRIDKIEGEK